VSTPNVPHLDDRELVMRRLEALGGRVQVLTQGDTRRLAPDLDQRLTALRARVEARRRGEE